MQNIGDVPTEAEKIENQNLKFYCQKNCNKIVLFDNGFLMNRNSNTTYRIFFAYSSSIVEI